jgi:putative Mn2+ efflux pump MntP
MIQTLLVALGLSMDAFAVSVSSGICIKEIRAFHAFRAALFFGLFQALMPVAGWLLGTAFRSYINGFDHWIAFALLALIGAKMVRESLAKDETVACEDPAAAGEPSLPGDAGAAATDAVGAAAAKADIRDLRTLLVLSVATSIDALAVGLSYSMLGADILFPALAIGIVTFAVCVAGFEFGKRIGTVLERRAETVGGLVLIGIGIKILVQHLAGKV